MAGHGMYDEIYNRMPLWVQNLLISGYGAVLYRQRYGRYYRAHLEQLRAKDYSNLISETDYQNEQFLRLLKHATQNSHFYHEFYKDVDLEKIRSLSEIKRLPILDKEVLRRNIEDVYTVSPSRGISSFTGGTTGKSLRVIFTKEDFQKRLAHLSFFELQHGVTEGMKRASFNGRQFVPAEPKQRVFWRDNLLRRQRLYSTFHMTPDNIPYYIENLEVFKPQVINGFVSAIYDLAKYINDRQIQLSFQPIAVFTTSETLLPFHRNEIQLAFGSPVRDQYSSSEGAPFITECPYGRLHYNTDTGVIETCSDGSILVTGFHTYGTPLIRYAIGDRIRFVSADVTCECGSCHPIVESIDGRQVDYLVSGKGGKVSLSHLADVIKGLPNCVSNLQFVQESQGELKILMVVDPQRFLHEHEESLLREMRYRFGRDVRITIEKVSSIPREASGKYRLIVNRLKR